MKYAQALLFSLSVIVMGMLLPEAACAHLAIYNSESEFLHAAPIVSTETFDEFPSPFYFFSPRVVIDGIAYTTASVPGAVCGGRQPCWTVESDVLLANLAHGSVFTFGPGGHVKAFGILFSSSQEFPGPHFDLTIHEVDGSTTVALLGAGGYAGILSTVGIDSLAVSADFPWQYDNVSHSQILSIPEPSLALSIALLPIAVLLMYRGRYLGTL